MTLAFKKGIPLFAVLALFLVGGCSGGQVASSDPNLFRVDPNTAKLFVYVAYDDPDDKPWLGESFRFRLDGGYLQDIDDSQFIDVVTSPGEEHTIDVEQISWAGNSESHAAIKEKFPAGAPTFVMVHIAPGQKPVLMNAGKDAGFLAVYHRQRACLCTKSFWDYFGF